MRLQRLPEPALMGGFAVSLLSEKVKNHERPESISFVSYRHRL
jgi:hypothetical protein